MIRLGRGWRIFVRSAPPPAPPANPIPGEQDSALDGFAQTDSIGDEERWRGCWSASRAGSSGKGENVHRAAMADGQACVRRHGLAQEGFEKQPGVAGVVVNIVTGTVVFGSTT